MKVTNFTAETNQGEQVHLSDYRGKVLLIVNTASKCGFTPQYADLQKVYDKYKDRGLEILGFPCNQFGEQEPGSNEEVQEFCTMNYGVSFPIFGKSDVRGVRANPLFTFLTEQAPFEGFDLGNPSGRMLNAFLSEKQPELLMGDSVKWNFTKFLADRDGNVIKRFESPVSPIELEAHIEALL